MRIAAISDLHITDCDTPEWSVLMQFLAHPLTQSADRIVLMGDIFDLLVGSHSYYLYKYLPFFEAISKFAAKGILVDYIEGNHDFAFQKIFKKIPNISVHQNSFSIEANGKKIYFGHGDELEIDNWSYRIYTLFIRSFVMRFVINLAPSWLIEQIGKRSSRYSRAKGTRKVHLVGTHARIDRFNDYVLHFLENNSVDILVCGHSHFHCDQLIGKTHYLNPGRAGHTHQFVWIEEDTCQLITLQSASLL